MNVVPNTLRSEVSPVGRVVLDRIEIESRIETLADRINQDCFGLDLCIIGILKGSLPFAADLSRRIEPSSSLDFLAVHRSQGTPSSACLVEGPHCGLSSRDILLVDDLIDTGLTMHAAWRHLMRFQPSSIRTCALISRPELRLADVQVDYVGFEVNSELLVGYGLDYRGRYRNLPYVGTLCDEPAQVPSTPLPAG